MNMRMRSGAILLLLCLTASAYAKVATEQEWDADWKLTMQAYTFNHFTFFEAVDKTASLGLRYIEAYPGQKLSAELGDAAFHHNMSQAERQAAIRKLQSAGVRLVNYGVVGLPNDEAECRKVFEFAKAMGIRTIASEPPEDAFDLIEQLVKEFDIQVAIHNHPEPSHYWDSETVLKACQNRDPRIGACADTGHWLRSGLNPIEQLRKLEGRVISLHLKDLNEAGNKGAHDVVWGTGAVGMKGILGELKRQGFAGHFSIEYEHNWLSSVPEIAECIPAFNRMEAEIGQSDWEWIFNGKDLTGWKGDKRLWTVRDGVIRGETTPDKQTDGNTFLVWEGGSLKDFEFMLKFRIRNGNSGVQYRSKEPAEYRITGYQAEIEDTPGKVGFLYHEGGRAWLVDVGDMMRITEKGEKKVVGRVGDQVAMMEAGYYDKQDWNEYHIICRGNQIEHYLNGYQTIELIDDDRITDPNDLGDRNGSIREGVLALQIHAGPPMLVEFKDVRIRRLEPEYGDAILAFNGVDLSEWAVSGPQAKNKWVVGKAAISPEGPNLLVAQEGTGEMINVVKEHNESLDFYSKAKFGDCRIEVEVMVPRGSNSGIYVMGEYEVQVLDSFGRSEMGPGDMGAIYGGYSPPVNASKAPGEWQQYVIEWKAPKFDANGRKVADAEFLRVQLNGQTLHENLVMPGPTPGGLTGKEAAEGPLMFQGNHGPVAYRNIVVRPLND